MNVLIFDAEILTGILFNKKFRKTFFNSVGVYLW